MTTAAEALEAHGFSGEQLLKLSRKAADDALRRHGAHLDPDRFDELADYMLLVGVRYASRYEPGHGLAIQTFLYRRMRIRYTDWLRYTMGDSRWGHRSRKLPPGAAPGRSTRKRAASEALAAGVSTFELSRVMGTSIQMIDTHYGHLARDSEDSIRARLDARSAQSGVYLASE